MTTENKYERTQTFVDAEGQRVTVVAEIENGKFSMVGDMGGSSGQIAGSIAPNTDAQRTLLGFWRDWHLNDMHAGTPEQEQFLTNYRATLTADAVFGYDEKVSALKAAGLYEVPHPDKPGEVYQYGHAFLKVELPEDFETELDECLDELKEEMEGQKVADMVKQVGEQAILDLLADDNGDYRLEDSEADLTLALALMLDLRVSELIDVDVSNAPRCEVQGTSYLAGTDSEMDHEWDQALDSYLDDCGVLDSVPENLRQYFDRDKWKEDAKTDGRGHALNSYDGDELEQEVNGTTYYAYRN